MPLHQLGPITRKAILAVQPNETKGVTVKAKETAKLLRGAGSAIRWT